MTFRKAVFWIHLAAGLAAGLVIGIMSLTGAALAFENEIVAWAERDARRVAPLAPGAPMLSLDELQGKFHDARPAARIASVTFSSDPAVAVVVSVGRDAAYYLNPYTGEVRQPASAGARRFMRLMEDWHRWLALGGDARPTGRAITGACNAAFLFLAVSGLWLWWPRKWRTKGLRRSLVFLRGATGKARDWNWHNVVGFWLLPVLVVLTCSGLVLSYRWAGDLVYRANGEAPPAAGAPQTGTAATPTPAAGRRPLDSTVLLAVVQRAYPDWETITLRPGDPGAPVALNVKQAGAWPRTATTTLTLDALTGAVLRREGFADFSAGRRARTWLRFLHTGQALGWGGQLLAGLGCIGGLVLVYTGFALAWRRFFLPKEAKT